jgi:antitoxin component YwqK of YwqJK toxin-antitoxin module
MKKTLNISFFIIIFFVFSINLKAQKNNPNGYNKFNYPSGTISSEGYMKNGKPVGYWKSYYPDGTLKSEGNRKNEKLDSVWRFYDRAGHLTQIIDYKNGIKSGYNKKYEFVNDSNHQANIIISKELYVNGEKNGKSYYYDEKARLKKTIEFEKNYKHGFEKHYDTLGNVNLIIKYSYDNITNSEKLNRKDKFGRKQGIWKTFYGNEKLHTYANYKDDKLNGYYREYNIYGELIKSDYYIDGKLTILKEDEDPKSKLKLKKEYFPDGKLKKSGAYINNKPIGIHKIYNEKGEIINSILFTDKGIKRGEGIVNKEGKREGNWKFVYPDGKIKSKGKYKKGKKEGKWIYYFNNGKKEQEGSFKNGRPVGLWIWNYENGNIRRTGKFKKGREQGLFYELTEEGDTLSQGSYLYGLKSGKWKYKVNDFIEIGTYINGKKDGNWKQYYQNNKLLFKGLYIEGFPDGKHKYYYPNGKLRLISIYAAGNKTGKWKKYDQEGNLETITEYRANKKYKIDGQKIKN